MFLSTVKKQVNRAQGRKRMDLYEDQDHYRIVGVVGYPSTCQGVYGCPSGNWDPSRVTFRGKVSDHRPCG